MVERLKIAIEKARFSRSGALATGETKPSPASRTSAARAPGAAETVTAEAARTPSPAPEPKPETGPVANGTAPDELPADPWQSLDPIRLDARRLGRNRIITYDKSSPAYVAFDSLRTRLLKVFRDNGWWRMAITSPTKGCGKTTVASNLAFSLARQPEVRSMLIDLDLRQPQIHQLLDQREPAEIERFLLGETAPEDYFRRVGANLALGLNSGRVQNPAELIQSPPAIAALDATWEKFHPHVAIFDMPPMLTCDDVLAFLPNVDCLLLVIGGGETKPSEVEECERLIADHTNFLGILLNKGDKVDTKTYGYDKS